MVAEMSALLPSLWYEVIMGATVPTPAAQYLRMSSEHLQYSLDNQQATLNDTPTNKAWRYCRPTRTPLRVELG